MSGWRARDIRRIARGTYRTVFLSSESYDCNYCYRLVIGTMANDGQRCETNNGGKRIKF